MSPAPASFPIVGIGASAGGLEAFEAFFHYVPEDCKMAFVVVPHLDPDHASILSEILQRATNLPVAEATNRHPLEPGHVYVIPPNRDITLAGGTLHLAPPAQPHGRRMPIDGFLSSLAAERGRAAIGIVLSGTGSDGTRGLRAIVDAGGTALVQEPSTAKYDGMPTSAIEAGFSARVLPPEDMPAALAHVVLGSRTDEAKATTQEDTPPALTDGNAVNRILTVLRSTTGHDFSQYKKNTVMRRIVRRMTAQDTDDAEHYARVLRHDRAEVEALFKDLLINVTGFFRDAEAFIALKDDVLRPYLADRRDGFIFRAWVAGCASGEEAYSIAIVLHELLNETTRAYKVQLYATDLDDEAIQIARAGHYPPTVAADITPERLAQHFVKTDDGFRIRKGIRDMVVFALQDVIKDPPFTRLDLLSCRNLMIYLEPELQERLITTFHYALKPDGVLFLSPSEHIGDHSALFTTLNRKWKLYRAAQSTRARKVFTTPGVPWAALDDDLVFDKEAKVEKTERTDFAQITRDMLLRTFAPASVLVDAKGDILYVHGDTEKYLRAAPGHATLNVVSMARPSLQLELYSALQAAGEPAAHITREITFENSGSPQRVGVSVQALPKQDTREHVLLISFQDLEPVLEKPVTQRDHPTTEARRAASLERDLAYTREKLHTIIEEQQASNEELKATNEEMQSTNEELQSTNEELETSKEELHSVNEELLSVNAELQAKIVQMDGVQNDMKNLLDNVGTGVVFLDDLLCVRRFTREARRIYRLVHSDVGRPLADIKSTIAGNHPDTLLGTAQNVMNTLKTHEEELHTLDGGAFLARVQPYRTTDNMIDGVVLTFTDITVRIAAQTLESAAKVREAREKAARMLAESIVDTVREPLLVLDGDLQVVTASHAFKAFFGLTTEDIVGHPIYALATRQFDIPELRDLLEKVLPQDNAFDDFSITVDVAQLGPRTLHLSGRRIIAAEDATPLILLVLDTANGAS